MIDIGIKCLIIKEECILPITATIMFYLPFIVLAMIIIYFSVRKPKQEGKRE